MLNFRRHHEIGRLYRVRSTELVAMMGFDGTEKLDKATEMQQERSLYR